jgi:uncharacterized protein YjcR
VVGGAKTLTQMATELGTSKSTVRRWLRRDHWDLWMERWASADELWVAAQQDREAKQIAHEVHGHAPIVDLNHCLANSQAKRSQPNSGEFVWLRPVAV